MPNSSRRRSRVLSAATIVAFLIVAAVAYASTLSFDGSMTTGITPWTSVGGGAQCANYGTTSKNSRYRGNLSFTTIGGWPAAQFDDPAVPPGTVLPDGTTATLESCDLNGKLAGSSATPTSPADQYIGFSVWVPSGFSIPNAPHRTNISEYHGTGIGPQPALAFFLYNNAILASLNTGLYNGSSYQYNASNTTLYAIPTGTLKANAWNDVVFHAHWAPDSTGALQVYHKPQGATVWAQTINWSGPTLAYDSAGSVGTSYFDNAAANYGPLFTSDFSVYMTKVVAGPSLTAIEPALP